MKVLWKTKKCGKQKFWKLKKGANLSKAVPLLHSALKFDALHLLVDIMSAKDEMLHGALRSVSGKVWASHMHVGALVILQNCVAYVEKLRALVLVESTMSIIGKNWLLDYTILPDDHSLTVDKSFLLILESTRVEVAVVLNELAYLKYESSKSTSSALESIIANK